MSGRLYRALSQMHQQVQETIEAAERSPAPDWVRISELKRRKLSIKDKMRRILENGREALSPRHLAGGVRQPRRIPLNGES